MIIAPPGSLKSNCLGEATKPVKYLAAKAHKQFEEANKNYQEELDAYEIQQDAIEKTLKKAYKNLVTCPSNQNAEIEFEIENYKKQLAALNKPEEPFEKRYITSDATIEVLQEILKNNPGGLLVERDELIALLMSFTMSGHEADRGFYLEGWNGGGDYQVDRIGRGSTYVPHLCLSVVGATQPEKIQAYIIKNISALLNDGLVQRFQLMVYPDFTKRDYIDEYPDNAAKEAVYKIAATIASDAFLKDCKTKPSEFDDMPLLHFSFERVAQARFKEWLIALEKQIDEEESAILKEHWSKYRGLIPSLALIFHVITMVQTGQAKANPVTLDSLNIAIAWHPYLESHARRVYGMGSNLTEKVVEVLAKKLKQGMFDNGFSARDVYRKNLKGIGTDAEFAEIACEELEKLGWLRAKYISPAKGQKAKTVYDINPNIKKIF
jgi:putative DNA primase/helicase